MKNVLYKKISSGSILETTSNPIIAKKMLNMKSPVNLVNELMHKEFELTLNVSYNMKAFFAQTFPFNFHRGLSPR